MTGRFCVFCEIVAGRAPATVYYQDADIIVVKNRLEWVPVMLLVMPKAHLTQEELWTGGLIGRIAQVAVEMGQAHCQEGFRLLSNFGRDALQTQEHAHLHVIGGTRLGHYA